MKTTKDLYGACLAIAIKAHHDQFRHDGKTPYIDHPIAVAKMFDDWLDKCKAILHDAIEDGKENGVDKEYVLWELSRIDVDGLFGGKIANIAFHVDILSHKKGESYNDYIKSIYFHDLQRFKIADIVCNLADSPSDYQKKKYKKAIKILLTR